MLSGFCKRIKYIHSRRCIGNAIVKMGNKDPQNLPLSLHDVDPHIIQQCLGQSHATPQSAALRVHALLHRYAAKSPLVTMGRPVFAPKITSFRGRIPKPNYLPHPWTCQTYHAKRHLDPISRFSTVHWTDRQTHRQTDRWLTGKFDDNRSFTLCRERHGLIIMSSFVKCKINSPQMCRALE